MAGVLLESVVKKYGAYTAVRGVSLRVHDGEFLTLLGPSGCGKTTTLRMIAGFINPDEGRILIDEENVTAMPPNKRGIGMVFQDYALFPHLTIFDNISFGLVERGVRKAERERRVEELLDLIRLPEIRGRYPAELSGGQQQRVALARAVAYTPRVLLMDEPLGALDLKLREAMQEELRRIQKALRITTIYVTHDQGEAMSMSDRIAVMRDGCIEQLDVPDRLYRQPRTEFVANFIGKVNLLVGRLIELGDEWLVVETAFGTLRAPADKQAAHVIGEDTTLAVRPEHLRLLSSGTTDGLNVLEGQVEVRTFTGNLLHLLIRVGAEQQLVLEARPDEATAEVGSRVLVGWKPEASVLFVRG